MTESAENLSLFAYYKSCWPDLGFAMRHLTDEGRSIFANHIRVEKTRHVSRVLGGLAYNRSQKPLDGQVIVAETDRDSEDPQDDLMMKAAAAGVIDHLVANRAVQPNGVVVGSIDAPNGASVREAMLNNGNYVSVHLGEVARVVLSPTPLLEAK